MKLASILLILSMASTALGDQQGELSFTIERTAAHSGFDGKMCWVHARAGAIPAGQPANDSQEPLGEREIDTVTNDVVTVLSRHAPASDFPEDELLFFVLDKGFDRTVYVELVVERDPLAAYSRWLTLAPVVVEDVQRLLQSKYLARRVLMPGDYDEKHAFFLYPTGLVFSPVAEGSNEQEKLLWTATQRKQQFEKRLHHRRERAAELKKRVQAQLQLAETEMLKTPKLIAWFDTLSEQWFKPSSLKQPVAPSREEEYYRWDVEGEEGSSLWVLFSNCSLPTVLCPDECRADWRLVDEAGEFKTDESSFRGARFCLLHLSSEERIRNRLEIQIDGEAILLDRSM